MNRLLIVITLFCVIGCCRPPVIARNSIQYGLSFNSFGVVQDKRTGLNLTPESPFSFKKGFSLSFDVCFKSDNKYYFGYIFRIIGRNNQHIDFLINNPKLIITYSTDKIIAECNLDEVNYVFDEYLSFEITLDVIENRIRISMNDKVFYAEAALANFQEMHLFFGKTNHPQFKANDVPSMVLKDIRINNEKNEPEYHWALSKHTQNGVYDELKNRFASVENPLWILDNHALWQQQQLFYTQNNPQICYNEAKNYIAISDRNYFYVYHMGLHALSRDPLNKGSMPHSRHANQIVYNPMDSCYYSYEFDMENPVDVVTYDEAGKKWNNYELELHSPDFWHHNKFISQRDSSLYLFGGYGHYKYRNYINKYNFNTRTWTRLDYQSASVPPPRYLSGLGVLDDTRFLIFGGYGSNSGAQELSPHNYYDLYEVDTKTMEAKKIWELNSPESDFVVANSLIVDTLNRCFYTLCFPQQVHNTSLFLGKFSMDVPRFEMAADRIPFAFQDIYSYVDLYLNKTTNELTAITVSPVGMDSTALVTVYSLAYPPLAETDLYQKTVENDHFVLFLLFFLGLVLTGIIITFVYSRNRKISSENKTEKNDKPEYKLTENSKPVDKRSGENAIFLFGGFQVLDNEGKNITGIFPSLAKQLFLLILLHTLKDGNGIPSSKIRDTLWFDKSAESAKNNQGVSTNRLRTIFEKVNTVNIVNKNSYWTVAFGDTLYCDYYEALVLIKNLKENSNPPLSEIRQLLNIVLAGGMLPNLQTEWIDSFKADFSNDLIDLLMDVIRTKYAELSPSTRMDIADAIFIQDSLNEDALKLKCRTLVQSGKNGLAKGVYNLFSKEYLALLGTPFKLSFEQVLSEE